MKKVLSITLSLIIIVTACLGFGTVALANNYSSAQAIQEELNKNKLNSSTPLTVTVTGTYNLSERLVIYSNTTFNCAGATFIKNYQNKLGKTKTPLPATATIKTLQLTAAHLMQTKPTEVY